MQAKMTYDDRIAAKARVRGLIRTGESGIQAINLALHDFVNCIDYAEYKQFLLSRSADVTICQSCHTTVKYGVETLIQTGQRELAISLY